MSIHKISLLICLLVLSGCVGIPHEVIGVDGQHIRAEDVLGAAKQQVFAATTRARDQDPTL